MATKSLRDRWIKGEDLEEIINEKLDTVEEIGDDYVRSKIENTLFTILEESLNKSLHKSKLFTKIEHDVMEIFLSENEGKVYDVIGYKDFKHIYHKVDEEKYDNNKTLDENLYDTYDILSSDHFTNVLMVNAKQKYIKNNVRDNIYFTKGDIIGVEGQLFIYDGDKFFRVELQD